MFDVKLISYLVAGTIPLELAFRCVLLVSSGWNNTLGVGFQIS